MIEIHNMMCIVRSNSRYYDEVKSYLQVKETSKKYNYYKKKTEVETTIRNLYEYLPQGDGIIFYKGLLRFLPTRYKRVIVEEPDLSLFNEVNDKLKDFNIFSLAGRVNENIGLRGDQIEAIRRMAKSRSGILQMATGCGKSIIIAGFLKLIKMLTGEQVGALILEPTQILVDSMIGTLRSCDLEAESYSSSRGDLSGNTIYVTHPRSLNNDYKKNSHLLDDVKILISDECHHQMNAVSWHNIDKWSKNLIYNLGLSASVMDSSKIYSDKLGIFSYDEAVVLGIYNKILLDLPPSYYIDRGILATPLLFRINHPAKEYLKEKSNWHELRKVKLESFDRVNLISKVAAFYNSIEFKTLILGGTKSNCLKMMEMIAKRGLSDVVRCSFGGGEFWKFDLDKDKPVPADEDSLAKFKSGEVSILIGTTHIYEGADIPSLDVVILANVGKKLRVLIQGIGRSLRRTKNGKYAHIIDFTDYMDGVLSYQSKTRRDICKSVIGIENKNIFDDIDFNRFKKLVTRLEDK